VGIQTSKLPLYDDEGEVIGQTLDNEEMYRAKGPMRISLEISQSLFDKTPLNWRQGF